MKTPRKQKYAQTRRTNLRLTEHRVTFLLKNRAAASIAARTDVSPASMNQFHDYFPSFHNHDIRFATSNRRLVYGIKCIKTFAVNPFRQILFTIHQHVSQCNCFKGYGKFSTLFLSHINYWTNLFLTLVPVESFREIVVNVQKTKTGNQPFFLCNTEYGMFPR